MVVQKKAVIDQIPEAMENFTMPVEVFGGFQSLIYKAAGITMSNAKLSLVAGRLAKRLRALKFSSYAEYLHYITKGDGSRNEEFQLFVDLLTTNETYFFREQQHFDHLKNVIIPAYKGSQPFRVWSSASSSGEEAYTIAMILAETMGMDGNWEVIGTDISTRVIKSAQMAIYSDQRTRLVPPQFRQKYLLKGVDKYAGYAAVIPRLKRHVRFEHYNLVSSPFRKEMFDVIFCRNVLIYFNADTKKTVLERLCHNLKSGGVLMTGHSESLHGIMPQLRCIKPAIYKRIIVKGEMGHGGQD